ncbi:NADP-dependent oxidoreductase domain-containing protein [Echria macrotheca]|uniref:NADP-dependent oxidoreductase domain-containing protein n=1 Tax=Echria macrotheca TaxID=438768 RepID=A0AAJ0BGB6_9PEZI|nr:NADP-dependent oxidoreductase domain-containing protein [Echria macrotheca]
MAYKINGKEVGNIGFGLMGLTWRPDHLSDEAIFPVLRQALASGCNCWNASPFYGTPDHNSLTVLRRYFEKYPEDADKALLNVKGCLRPGFKLDASADGVAWSIADSLAMLGGAAKIDQFEPARKDPKVDIETTVRSIAEHARRGDVGGVSLSEVSAQTIRRAAEVARIESVEVELSLWSTDPLENGVLETCGELGILVYAYAPLGRGMLAGGIKSPEDIVEGDLRKDYPRFQPGAFETNLRLVDEVKKLAAAKKCTPAQIAINWVLALSRRPGMPKIIPIPGASSVERVRENAVEIELSEDDMAELDRLIREFPPVGERYPEHGMALLDR